MTDDTFELRRLHFDGEQLSDAERDQIQEWHEAVGHRDSTCFCCCERCDPR